MSKFLKVKKINVLKMACITSLVYVLLSGIIFLTVGLFGLVQGNFMGLFIILDPIIYGIAGFISGLVMGYLYNIVSRWIGGFEVEVEEIKKFSE